MFRWTLNVRWLESSSPSRSSHSYWWKRPVADWVTILFVFHLLYRLVFWNQHWYGILTFNLVTIFYQLRRQDCRIFHPTSSGTSWQDLYPHLHSHFGRRQAEAIKHLMDHCSLWPVDNDHIVFNIHQALIWLPVSKQFPSAAVVTELAQVIHVFDQQVAVAGFTKTDMCCEW